MNFVEVSRKRQFVRSAPGPFLCLVQAMVLCPQSCGVWDEGQPSLRVEALRTGMSRDSYMFETNKGEYHWLQWGCWCSYCNSKDMNSHYPITYLSGIQIVVGNGLNSKCFLEFVFQEFCVLWGIMDTAWYPGLQLYDSEPGNFIPQ